MNIEQQLDFRDDLVGTYTCLETYSYFDPINDTITNWSTDTISDNTMITVEKFQDSSLNVIIGNYNFIGTYQKIGPFNEKETFTCLECNGPPDYAKFFENDSIYIYRKYGVTNNRDYYGKKQ